LIDDALIPHLRTLLKDLAAQRVLVLTAGDAILVATLAAGLPPDGVLFAFEADPTLAARSRALFAEAGVAGKIHVMIGSSDRLLHKVAGPFDLVIAAGGAPIPAPALTRVRALLRPEGVLISHGVPDDGRWDTSGLDAGSGLVKSVKR